jgi:hypothetical protein
MRIDLKDCKVYIEGGGESESLEIKVGDGTVDYTEAQEREYLLDRGELDVVRDGDDTPLEVSLSFTWEYLRSLSGEDITPEEALKQTGHASDWSSTDDDTCQPYCVDIVVIHEPPCTDNTAHLETYTFPMFRWESMPHSFNDASVSVSGKCNVKAPTIARSAS